MKKDDDASDWTGPGDSNGPVPRVDPKEIFKDLSLIRLKYGGIGAGTREVVSKIPVKKPGKQDFFRTCLAEEMTLITGLYEDKDMREFYAIAPNMVDAMQDLDAVTPVKLVPTVTRQGANMMTPVKLPAEGTSMTGWHETMLAAIELAGSKWVRLSADMALGGYRVFEAIGNLGEPKFPDMSLNEMLELGFKGRIIDSEENPVYKKLVGRI